MAAIIDYRGKTPRKTTAGVPLITAKIVKGGRIEAPDEFVDPDEYEDWMRRGLPQVGDVVITTEAPLGEVAQLQDARVALAQRFILLRGAPAILDNTYLKFLMMSANVQSQLRGRASGTTVLGIKQSELRKVNLLLPPIAEQLAIAGVLGALDDKIEQNQRTAQALERLAQAIFRAWFVDFEPVKAKAAGATAFPSMPQSVFDALPTRFVDSTVGPIPHGWEISTVGNCASYLSRGITPTYVEDSGVLVLNQRCIRDFAIDYGKARRHNSSARQIDGREIKVGDVLINSTGVGTLGRLAQVLHLPEPAIVDTHVTVVRPASGIRACYFGQRLIYLQPYIESLGEGTTGQTELSRRKVSELPMLVPTPHLMDAYEDVASPILELLSQTRLEDSRLVGIRDRLLPKLLSGEVRVEVE